MLHVTVLKDHPYHLTKYEGKGTKISILKLFNELGKIWKWAIPEKIQTGGVEDILF